MFHSDAEFKHYIIENYPEVTDSRIDDDHWDLPCTQCKLTRDFQVIKYYMAARQGAYIAYSGPSGPVIPLEVGR
jgi:hypothetical protein